MKFHELKAITARYRDAQTTDQLPNLQEVLQELGIDSGSLYQELEMTSPFVDTHQDISDSNAHVSLHSHAFYELLYCRGGDGVEYLVGSDRYSLRRGDIILVPPGVSHRPILPPRMQEPYSRDVLWISTGFMDSLAPFFSRQGILATGHNTPIRTAGTRWETIGKHFRQGVREAEAEAPGWELAVMGNTLTILSLLMRAYMDRSAGILKTQKRELLDDITAYIEQHYTRQLSIRDLAKQFYVSESTVSHLFRQKMGVSLHRYVTQRRLIGAKNRILEGVPLETVAEQVGFADYSSFYRAFKGEYGISPRQFRSQSSIKT